MKHIHNNLFRVLPLLTLGVGAMLAFDSTAQAQPSGRGRGGNRQFGQNFGERGNQQLVPAPRLAVPTVEELTDALELTPEQQKKMTSVLAEMQKRINNTLTAEQRTKLETLRTQPVAPQLAKEEWQEGRGNVRPEKGQGGMGRQGGRQGMGGQAFGGGRGMGGRGQGFGGPGRGGQERGAQEFGGPEAQGGARPFGGQSFGAPEGKAQSFGGPGMGGPGRGGRRGMGQGGMRPGPDGMRGNEGPFGMGQPPQPEPMLPQD